MTLEYDMKEEFETEETKHYNISRKGLVIGLLIIDKKYAEIKNCRKLTIQ